MEADLFLCCNYIKMCGLYAGLDLIEEDSMKCTVFVTRNVEVIKETADYSSWMLYTNATQKQHFKKQV